MTRRSAERGDLYLEAQNGEIFSRHRRRQFLDAFVYTPRRPSLHYLSSKTEKALSAQEVSESGRPLPEFPELPFREVIVKPCRFFYKVKDNDVWVVAVCHAAQLPGEPEN